MNLVLNLKEEEISLVEKYASKYGVSVEDFIKDIVLDKLNDEKNMEVYENAIKSYTNNPSSYSHSSIIRDLGLAR